MPVPPTMLASVHSESHGHCGVHVHAFRNGWKIGCPRRCGRVCSLLCYLKDRRKFGCPCSGKGVASAHSKLIGNSEVHACRTACVCFCVSKKGTFGIPVPPNWLDCVLRNQMNMCPSTPVQPDVPAYVRWKVGCPCQCMSPCFGIFAVEITWKIWVRAGFIVNSGPNPTRSERTLRCDRWLILSWALEPQTHKQFGTHQCSKILKTNQKLASPKNP